MIIWGCRHGYFQTYQVHGLQVKSSILEWSTQLRIHNGSTGSHQSCEWIQAGSGGLDQTLDR